MANTAPYYQFVFPGLTEYMTGNGNVTLSHGARPSSFTIEVAEIQKPFRQVNTLSLTVNGRDIVRFPNCAVDGIYRSSGSQNRSTIKILDRRWKWWKGGGVMSGSYNVRKPRLFTTVNEFETPSSVGLIPETIRHPRQLAAMCLVQLGETEFDVSALPAYVDPLSAPAINWDYIPAAQALDELVTSLGFRIVLGSDNRIRICQSGYGQNLPNGAIKSFQDSLESAAVPDSVMFISGPTIWQGLLKLEAVGVDINGHVRPINQLSYTPWGGWGQQSPVHVDQGIMYGSTERQRDKARSLAKMSVFRWYRVAGQLNGRLGPVPGHDGPVNHLWQYQLRDKLIDTSMANDGSTNTGKPSVIGRWAAFTLSHYNFEEQDQLGNTTVGSTYPENFSIDTENSIVKFDRPLYLYGNGQNEPAELYLFTSYMIRDYYTRRPERVWIQTRLPVIPTGTGSLPIKVDDVYRTVNIGFSSEGGTYRVTGATANDQEIKNAAYFYSNTQISELIPKRGQDREYDGFVNISPDGLTQQVSWSMVNGLASTRASSNTEHSVLVPRYHQRQATSQAQSINEKIKALERSTE